MTSSRSCSSSATISLLISTVLSGSRIEAGAAARAAVNDAGNRARCSAFTTARSAVAIADRPDPADSAVSFPRRYDSSVDAGACAVCAAACAVARQLGLALSFTSPDGSILLRTSAIWFLNDPQFSASAFSVGKGR